LILIHDIEENNGSIKFLCRVAFALKPINLKEISSAKNVAFNSRKVLTEKTYLSILNSVKRQDNRFFDFKCSVIKGKVYV